MDIQVMMLSEVSQTKKTNTLRCHSYVESEKNNNKKKTTNKQNETKMNS